jgi:hypothetical protein
MNSRLINSFAFAVIAAMTLLCGSRSAHALVMTVEVLSISQVPPYTSRVKLGHMVNGRTYMISILVGGSFRVTCPSSVTGTIEGQNYAPQTLLPPNVLTVGVPAGWLPAERELPGFINVPGGTTLTCSYYWTASAKEAMYQLGAGGSGIPIGGDTYTQSDTRVFEMYMPGGDADSDNGCIH